MKYLSSQIWAIKHLKRGPPFAFPFGSPDLPPNPLSVRQQLAIVNKIKIKCCWCEKANWGEREWVSAGMAAWRGALRRGAERTWLGPARRAEGRSTYV